MDTINTAHCNNINQFTFVKKLKLYIFRNYIVVSRFRS